ncbi:hypothetical protein PNQ29_08665 [Halobacterium salinarum]|uniref:DUF7344 domain-containing protein n=1 Tax=Halobacterium salinarum TaxID=2242 RepID=UPI002553834C|nr:hypothetical protein [Halobacterium salinarum]MDL0118541.1 hypothetical protein [Halobacterium salinarum]MDL0119163.1 hypothetical protein [Halobacterium salinarum]MDL0119798.1 hypothetical protein [Halobacterium salinarum]
MTAATPNTNNVANVFTLLSNARRLLLVNYLALFEYGRKVEVRHLARVIGSIETQTPPRSVATEHYESAYNSLIQTHLPKLDKQGIIEYDDRAKVVTVTPEIKKYAALIAITRYVLHSKNHHV